MPMFVDWRAVLHLFHARPRVCAIAFVCGPAFPFGKDLVLRLGVINRSAENDMRPPSSRRLNAINFRYETKHPASLDVGASKQRNGSVTWPRQRRRQER